MLTLIPDCQVSPCTVTLPFPSLLHFTLCTQVTAQPSRLVWKLRFTSWRTSMYINYLEFFLMGDLSLSLHLFIYSVTHVYQYGLMDIIFILWVIIQYTLFYCTNCLVLALMSLWHTPVIWGFCLVFNISLVSLQDAPELSFFIPCPRSKMSHFCKFLLLENSFRNQDLVLGVLTAFRLSHLRARKYMCVYNSM